MRFLSPMLDAVFPPRETEILVRSLSSDSLLHEMHPIVSGDYGLLVISLFPYTNALVQACILEAKFHGSMRAAQLLGSALHEFLCEYESDLIPWNALLPLMIPIPLSAKREQERGYNQTERIAEFALENLLNIELNMNILHRTRETAPQTSLTGSARRKNLQNAFATQSSCDRERSYIIFDDVVTTGNTLHSATESLSNEGARHIISLTLAY